ncbi:CLUMA_CG003235, isoform A [Clunio marinus]|uniref:CLUMA_CG003235, isoform A n=1 Tax=Clunio marinus TaxID=568069 RepID=A0A1J1HNJ4_9DIPT|nr:CLUMA_CG003235, isoform A [Clunio marinus]
MEDDMEEILDRHRAEKKDLRNKIINMKRTSGKKDKKKLQEEITQMENDMIARHTEELEKLKLDDSKEEGTSPQIPHQENIEVVQRISKAQKRRDKKEQDAKRREEELIQAEEDNKNSSRNLETKAINLILKARNLSLHTIKSDGDCLYNALKYQLEQVGINQTVESLRKIAADYIRANKDDIICYMTSSKSDDLMSQDEFNDYCNQVENTKAWGSQIEIQAISHSLKVIIEVLQSSGTPIITGSDFVGRPRLVVTYHRHFFGLGEHYNGTKFASSNEDSEEVY